DTALGTGSLTIYGGTLDTETEFINAHANAVIVNGDFTADNGTPLNLGTGPISLGTTPGATRTMTVSFMPLILGGVIGNGTTANSIVKAGTGMLVLSGASTYSGGTTVSAGTLFARSGSALG